MNWAKESTPTYLREQALKAKRKREKQITGRKTKMIKIKEHPVTYKEIFID